MLALLLFSSCTKEGNLIVIEDEQPADTRPIVYFLAKEGAMGDQGFIDNFYKGVIKATESNNLMCSSLELPLDTLELDLVMRNVFQNMADYDSSHRLLLVIANDNMEWMFHRYADDIKNLTNLDVLLAESNDTTLPVHTLSFNGYGACYQAAQVVAAGMDDVSRTLVFSANPTAKSLEEMRNGFQQGIDDYLAADSSRVLGVDYSYLSDTDGGYNNADSLYKLCYYVDRYDLVLPLCGGSISGLFRYNREHPESFYTIGVDVNQQQYSTNVPFSICKYVDMAVADWITQWSSGETPAMHLRYGLDSGYLNLEVADEYHEQLQLVIDESFINAVEKEQEYENENQDNDNE